MEVFLKTSKVTKQGKFQSYCSNLSYFLLLAHSCSQLLELLANNHSLSERRIIFLPWLLKFYHVLVVLELTQVCTFLQLSWIKGSGLAPFPGCQGSCGIVSNRLVGLVMSFNVCKGLKC